MKFFWLIEWTNSPYRWPIYVASIRDVEETTTDPWIAERFLSKKDASDFLLTYSISRDGEEWKPVEHGFETPGEEVVRRLE